MMDPTDAAGAQCVDSNQGEQASSRSSGEPCEGPLGPESQEADQRQVCGRSPALASSGSDFAVDVLKVQNERDLQAREEVSKLECKAVTRHVTDLEALLRDEKMLRSSVLSVCKKLVAGIEERSRQMTLLKESVGDALREVEKLEGAAKQRQKEADEARASGQELEQQTRAVHNRFNDLKSQRNRANELAAAERSGRIVQAERDELRECIASALRQMSLLRGETLVLQARLLGVKLQLEDERSKTRLLTDAMREVQAQAEQLSGELAAERGASKRFADKAFVHERQSAELRAELQKVEEVRKAEQRSVTARLEGRLAQAADLLQQTEEGNRTSVRTIRQLEMLLEITKRQVEDERRRSDELKEDEDAFSNRARELKAALDANSQHSQEKERRLKLQLELHEALKLHEKLTSELVACGEAWDSLRQSDRQCKLH